jgi:nicotinate-nucleotide pyrophosphorylase (carboxylating)
MTTPTDPCADPSVDPNALTLPQLWSAVVDRGELRALLALARREDLGSTGDVTSRCTVAEGRRGHAVVRARRAGVVAGLAALPTLLEVFEVDGRAQPRLADGSSCAADEVLLELAGSLRDLLAVERTLLNLLGRLCGVASATRRCVWAIEGTAARICDTRKTTPGLRTLEKYAVRCGGGWLHRIGLFDAMLIKDNHIAGLSPSALAAAVAAAAAAGRAAQPLRFVEVEVDTLQQLEAVLSLPEGVVDMVLLDNMSTTQLRQAVRRRGGSRRPLLEASGGIGLESLRDVAECGVDRISLGAITHSAGVLDLGMDMGLEPSSR